MEGEIGVGVGGRRSEVGGGGWECGKRNAEMGLGVGRLASEAGVEEGEKLK